MKAKILIVDDEPSIRTSLSELFKEQGYEALAVEDGQTAIELMNGGGRIDLVMLDCILPDIHGLEVLEKLKEGQPHIPVIMMTGQGSVPQSVEAMAKGASDYILKPFNIDELLLRVQKGLDTQELAEQVEFFHTQRMGEWAAQYVEGPNPIMQQIYERVDLIAQSSSTTVFIHGETGTGKEVIARRLHMSSSRKKKPFVEVNATALSAELLESELFGHEAGSFTGATQQKKGLFEIADGGTLFLDEIGDMGLNMQAKLLRAIQEKSIRRVGGTENIPVDIRLVTASNRNLEERVREGEFREDLYYRLNVVPILLPPLRDRKDDLRTLVEHFVEHFNHQLGTKVSKITAAAWHQLEGYDWPGNVRELQNLIERTLLLECRGESLDGHHLKFGAGLWIGPKGEGGGIVGTQVSLEEVERQHISGVLDSTGGNKNKAASILGIDRTTLYNKLKKYEI